MMHTHTCTHATHMHTLPTHTCMHAHTYNSVHLLFCQWCDVFYVTANIGGTLGVCIGGSFLTIIEFIDFAIKRLTYLVQRRGRSNQRINDVGTSKVIKTFHQ